MIAWVLTYFNIQQKEEKMPRGVGYGGGFKKKKKNKTKPKPKTKKR